jgi:hypothetical protein
MSINNKIFKLNAFKLLESLKYIEYKFFIFFVEINLKKELYL